MQHPSTPITTLPWSQLDWTGQSPISMTSLPQIGGQWNYHWAELSANIDGVDVHQSDSLDDDTWLLTKPLAASASEHTQWVTQAAYLLKYKTKPQALVLFTTGEVLRTKRLFQLNDISISIWPRNNSSQPEKPIINTNQNAKLLI